MQRKVIAVMGLGDVLGKALRGVDGDREVAGPLGNLDGDALGLLELAEIGHGDLEDGMVGEIGGADMPQARSDLEAVGLRVAAEKLRLLELGNRPMNRRAGKAE